MALSLLIYKMGTIELLGVISELMSTKQFSQYLAHNKSSAQP